jgi:hypothetical protein
MKLIDILKEIINEGVARRKDGSLTLSLINNPNDLLVTNIDGNTQREGNTVYYTFEYNPKYENGEEVKLAADDIKNLENINKEELYKLTLKSIESVFNKNFVPDVVYYLGSSKGLSSFIAKVIKDNYPDIEILPLGKKEFPSWQDMLVDDYKEQAKGQRQITRIENTAKKMWDAEGGKIKSSGYDVQTRAFFKSKYELEKILAQKEKLSQEKILFVDDNAQKGIDFAHIKKMVPEAKKIAFYVSIALPREGATTTKAFNTIKKKFCLKNTDSKYFKSFTDSQKNKTLYVSSNHPEILFLKKGLKVDDVPQKIGDTTYFKFKKDTNIRSIDDIPKCEQ